MRVSVFGHTVFHGPIHFGILARSKEFSSVLGNRFAVGNRGSGVELLSIIRQQLEIDLYGFRVRNKRIDLMRFLQMLPSLSGVSLHHHRGPEIVVRRGTSW